MAQAAWAGAGGADEVEDAEHGRGEVLEGDISPDPIPSAVVAAAAAVPDPDDDLSLYPLPLISSCHSSSPPLLPRGIHDV